MRATVPVSLACGLVTGCLAISVLAQPVPLGVEFQVNTHTIERQYAPVAAMDGDGDFAVVWASFGQDGSLQGIFAQRYASSGVAVAGEFQVNTFTPAQQYFPSIAMDGDGDFVVAWQSLGQDGPSHGVFARRFSSAGVALATEFQVSIFTTSGQARPSVGMDDSGDFVVAWGSEQDGDGYGIFARRFDATGTAQGSEFQVNSYTIRGQARPSVALDGDGDFVIAYDSFELDGSLDAIFAQRFDANGVALGVEFQVNTYTSDTQFQPVVAMDADGDFVIAWSGFRDSYNVFSIFAQRFASSGAAQGPEFLVNSHTVYSQEYPSLGIASDGGFVVAWTGYDQDGSYAGVFARRFDAAGAALGTEFQVNTYTTGDQSRPALAIDDDGEFVVAWQSQGLGLLPQQDGNFSGVFAQRFGEVVGSTPLSVDIKPGSVPNNVNVNSNAMVKVAILTTSVADGDDSDFDAFDVDAFTAGFGPAGAPFVTQQAQDVDSDGDIDMVLSFRANATGIPCGATQATLTAMTFDDEAVQGTDSVHTVGGGC